jgi:hypothetical protein
MLVCAEHFGTGMAATLSPKSTPSPPDIERELKELGAQACLAPRDCPTGEGALRRVKPEEARSAPPIRSRFRKGFSQS